MRAGLLDYFNGSVARADGMKLLAAFDSSTSAFEPTELSNIERNRAEE